MIQYDPHRWFDHLFDAKGSLILEITPRVLACTFWASVVVAFDHHVRPVGLPSTVHTLVGTATWAAPGVPHEFIVRPFLGRTSLMGQHYQRMPKCGAMRGRSLEG